VAEALVLVVSIGRPVDGLPNAGGFEETAEVGENSGGGGAVEASWGCPDAPNGCESGGGTWNGRCYEKVLTTDPTDDTPIGHEPGTPGITYRDLWAGRKTGAIKACGTGGWPFWSPSPDAPPSGEDIARLILLKVQGIVTAPGLGVFPGALQEDDAEAMGLVGVPTWFWADNPGPGIGSPLIVTDSLGGYALTGQAVLDHIDYDTGDNAVVTCGVGSVPAGVHRPTHSYSNCDHTYEHRGTYVITATTYVAVEFWGAGKHGAMTLELQRSGTYHVGEIQVLIVE